MTKLRIFIDELKWAKAWGKYRGGVSVRWRRTIPYLWHVWREQ